MKKLTFLTFALVGFLLMTSCKKDPVAPTISVFEGYEGSTCVTENAQVFSGDEIHVGFTGTGEKLTKIEVTVSQNGTVLDFHQHQWESPTSNFEFVCDFTIEAIGTVTITGTVTDAVGQTASKSFNIFYVEKPKPNAKFLGDYDGTALLNGTLIIEIPGMEPIQQEFTNQEYPVYVGIGEGENDNEVVAECHVNDRVFTATGIVDGDKITANDLHETITLNYEYNGMTLSPEIDVIYSLTATLEGDVLTFEGNYEGNGDISVFLFTGTISLDGIIGGSLNKLPPI